MEPVVRIAQAIVLAAALGGGCMVGPDYHPPAAPTADHWSMDERVRSDRAAEDAWWHAFADAKLDALVDAARRQNPTLRAAGLRVMQAQALRGVAIGGLFPQTQEANAAFSRARSSLNGGVPVPVRDRASWQVGFDAAWEIDLWGRFRRAIEAADADLLAAVAEYDDVLVTLVAEVAANYVRIRVLEERLALAQENVRVQGEGLELARVRFESGGTSELDVQEATTLLSDTEATIPGLEIERRQAQDALGVLLGLAPDGVHELVDPSNGIPAAPAAVFVGIPAELLLRRPDVRAAERRLAAQSARIGVAVSDLLPRLQLVGSVGFSAEEAARLVEGRSLEALGGPRFDWPVLNYGRLVNAVRAQDAAFEEQAAVYEGAVLRAQQEVEDSLAGYLRGAEQVARLGKSAAAARRAVQLSLVQYREGAADYTRVLTTQQAKLRADDQLATSRGALTLSVIGLYKALGGGWEVRTGQDFVADETRRRLPRRSLWGGLPSSASRAGDVRAAESGTEGDRRPGVLRWRAWWPKW